MPVINPDSDTPLFLHPEAEVALVQSLAISFEPQVILIFPGGETERTAVTEAQARALIRHLGEEDGDAPT